MKSIVFFDSHCPLCIRTINFLGRHADKKLSFAPLDGTTAENTFLGSLHYLRDLNTVILLERPHGKIWLRGRAVFRVLWLLGGWWKFIGWLYGMPFVDFFYKIVAKHRKRGGDLPTLSVKMLP
jgi:predicted DCC family thiol-disulfide oxidoreductase YuxK